MKEKTLVIGATGIIGKRVVRHLQTFGLPVRAATRLPIPYAVTHPHLDVVLFDYEDPATYRPTVSGVSKALIIPRRGDLNPQKTVIPLIEQAREAGVSHIVLVTHFDAERYTPSGLYDLESFLIGSGIMYTILRPNWLMQTFNPGFLWPMIRKTDAIFCPTGSGQTSFVDAEDVAAVATVALTEEGHLDRIYPLTGGEALSYDDVAQIISNAGQRPVKFFPTSDEEFRNTLVKAGWDPQQVEILIDRFALVRDGFTAGVNDQVALLLGRRPGRFLDYVYDRPRIWRTDF